MTRSFENGVWTSEEAAEQAESFKPKVQKEIVSSLESRGKFGATDQELEDELLRPGNTLRPARVDLVRQGIVVASDSWRYTKARRRAIVWILAEYAGTDQTN